MSKRTIAVAVATVAVLAAIAAVGAISGSKHPAKNQGRVLAYRPSMPTALVKGHIADLLLRNGREGGQGGDPDAGVSPAAQAVADRAYPFTGIGFAESKRAAAAAATVRGRSAHFGNNWQEVGPYTLNVDRLGTQTFLRPTQWSGRVTAMAVAPGCDASACR